MPRQTTSPRDALAVSFPEVAATWHLDRNSDAARAQGRESESSHPWWRCANGHEWQESLASRPALPAWKDGDRAACRVCVGYHVIVSFDCGHTTEAPARFAEPERGCPACRKARWAARQAALNQQFRTNSAAAKALYAQSLDEAQELLDALPVPDAPGPLLLEWRRTTLHNIRGAIVDERLFGKTGVVGAALAHHREAAKALTPPVEALQAAAATR